MTDKEKSKRGLFILFSRLQFAYFCRNKRREGQIAEELDNRIVPYHFDNPVKRLSSFIPG